MGSLMRLCLISLVLLVANGCRAPAPRHEPEATGRRKQIFVVIDDAGLLLEETQQFLDIPVPMTIAVLPHQKQTSEVCSAITDHTDKEMILHQPMEAYNSTKNPGKGAIFNTTDPSEVPAILDYNLASVRGAKGMNNHMGSRVTENVVLMHAVMRYCKANGLFFLDSKTAYNSMVGRVATREHMHMEERHVFLDIKHDRETIRRAWAQTVARAREHGYAIAIGHAWSTETAAAIRDSYRTLQNQGYTFHLLSELYQ
jgi:polysaccharide deacetylase 2 family uncharacterized protein YibQ